MQTAVRLSEGGVVRLLMTALQQAECLLMTTFLQTEHPPDDYITRVEPMFLLIPLLLEVRCRLRNISLVIAGNLYLKDLNTETQPCVWAEIRQAGALVEATAVRLHVYLNGSTAVCTVQHSAVYLHVYLNGSAAAAALYSYLLQSHPRLAAEGHAMRFPGMPFLWVIHF